MRRRRQRRLGQLHDEPPASHHLERRCVTVGVPGGARASHRFATAGGDQAATAAPNGGRSGMYPCPIGAPTALTSRTWSTTVTCSGATARATQWDPPSAELDHRRPHEVQRRESRRCRSPHGHQGRTQPVGLERGPAAASRPRSGPAAWSSRWICSRRAVRDLGQGEGLVRAGGEDLHQGDHRLVCGEGLVVCDT